MVLEPATEVVTVVTVVVTVEVATVGVVGAHSAFQSQQQSPYIRHASSQWQLSVGTNTMQPTTAQVGPARVVVAVLACELAVEEEAVTLDVTVVVWVVEEPEVAAALVEIAAVLGTQRP